jgi:hypothetical protein
MERLSRTTVNTSSPIRLWLRQVIANLPSVQSCRIDSEGVVIARAWLGTETHMHLLDTSPKTRDLKHWLQESNRIGAACLFIPHIHLTPTDTQVVTPSEWMLALHELNGEKFYAYHEDADGCQIDQLHLARAGGDRRQTHHQANLPIRQLHFYRQTVKLQALRGDWISASFGTEQFWKSADYVAARAHKQAQERAERGNAAYQYNYEFNFGGVGQATRQHDQPNDAPAKPARPLTKLEQAYAMLGQPTSATCDALKAAFRLRARELHPDTSALPKAEAETQFKALSEAYTLIRETRAC